MVFRDLININYVLLYEDRLCFKRIPSILADVVSVISFPLKTRDGRILSSVDDVVTICKFVEINVYILLKIKFYSIKLS